MIGSLLVALVIVPSLSLVLLKNEKLEETSLVMNLKKIYCIVLKKLPVYKKWVVASAFSLLGLALIVGANLGTEFVPVLEEGSIFIGTTMTPSISLEEAVKMVLKMEKDLKALPEVKEIVSRIGRPEAGSHPHPVNYAEIQIELVSENKWRPGVDKQMLIKKMEEKLKKFPGAQFNFTQPIQNAFDELVSGVKTQLAIKVFGENLDILQAKAKEVKETIKDVPGLVDLMVEQSFGQPQILVEADREKCSRYGIDVSRILNLIETAVGGEVIDSMFVEMRRFAIHLRYQENFRDSAEAIQELLIATPDDQLILLSQVANVKIVNAPVQINRENNMRRWTVMGNIRGSDLGTVVAEIRRLIREKVTLPVGYHVEFGGQFENQQRAMLKLAIIVPGVILAVFVLLWLSFNSFRHALIIFTMVPLSVTGGVFGLWVMNEFLSVPASIGFIALFGMAMLDGMVMLSCFNHLRVEGKDLWQTVLEGCQTRLPPVLATTVTTLLGLLPLLLASGPGAEIQRPLASVVVFGLFSSTFLTLVVIPSIYLLIEERELHSS
jgi:cobalt-zinc-cadmium resistance protein CzcA